MADKIFADGFIVKHPHANAPSFVKGSISVKVSEAIAFLTKHQERDWVNLDLLESRDRSKLYLSLNTFKPEAKTAPAAEAYPEEDINPEDIPF